LSILFVAPVAFAVVGMVFAGAYRYTTEEIYEDYKSDIAAGVVVTQLLVLLVLFTLFMLVPVGTLLLGGELVDAALLVGLTVVYLVFFTFFEILGVSLYVGIPTFLGAFAGGLVVSALDA
jgi:hypothetical protein